MKKKFASLVFNRLLGWRLEGYDPAILPKFVFAAAPHTSNFDFILGVLARTIMGLNTVFLGKKELFRFPFGGLFRWLGGYPVERSKSTNLVDAIAAIFHQKEVFSVVVAPEGSRAKRKNWKTGFYYIALQAQVPIVFVGFDYSTKVVRIREPFVPTGDYNADMQQIQSFYATIRGRFPDRESPIL